ncbi:MAG: NAD(P)-binding protein, partial [Sphingomonas sp.]|nr:NAD(P)-binding protein [Sphingomonas sp.]
MTKSPLTAIVVGAGIGGLASAIALQRAGYAVRVVERAPVLAPIGAALSMWANAVDALDRLGVGEAHAHANGVFLPRPLGARREPALDADLDGLRLGVEAQHVAAVR